MADPNGWGELGRVGFEQNKVRYFGLRVVPREIADFIDTGSIGLEAMMRSISFDREPREQDGIQTDRIAIQGYCLLPALNKREIVSGSVANRYLRRRVIFPKIQFHGGPLADHIICRSAVCNDPMRSRHKLTGN